MVFRKVKLLWLISLILLSILMTTILLSTDVMVLFNDTHDSTMNMHVNINDKKFQYHGKSYQQKSGFAPVWGWECIEGTCQKILIDPKKEAAALSLPACRLLCSEAGALWPKPTGEVNIGKLLEKINMNNIDIIGYKNETPISGLIIAAGEIFKEQIKKRSQESNSEEGKSLLINVNIQNLDVARLELSTNESYFLKVDHSSDGNIQVDISAPTFFGFRHGLQTLNQLIIFDDLREQLQIPRFVLIKDNPAYPYRGILLDTSRNFITMSAIKNTLTAMAASKLNTFHWHITDSHSFPYYSPSRPELSRFGAYSPKKIYRPSDIKEIIDYATVRGIRVLPEFDGPAHVGEGWQNTGLVTCLKWQPWQLYCGEPPCGQFDPTQDELYDVLEDIYGDMLNQFNPDIFHMGGDEVNFNCWNSTVNIKKWMQKNRWGLKEGGFFKLWNHFQNNALKRLHKKARKKIPVIMWTSDLTKEPYLEKYLPKDEYIIQIWTKANDSQIDLLLNKGYRVILSNYDALYMDCGFSGWVADGNNWCSPYIGWQKVYQNTPFQVVGTRVKQVLGEEATMWTEQADSTSIDSRLWPRAAAMAEVLWSEPTTGWEEAEERMLVQRERLVELGINADAIEPEWCTQNEEHCRKGAQFNKPNNLEYK